MGKTTGGIRSKTTGSGLIKTVNVKLTARAISRKFDELGAGSTAAIGGLIRVAAKTLTKAEMAKFQDAVVKVDRPTGRIPQDYSNALAQAYKEGKASGNKKYTQAVEKFLKR